MANKAVRAGVVAQVCAYFEWDVHCLLAVFYVVSGNPVFERGIVGGSNLVQEPALFHVDPWRGAANVRRAAFSGGDFYCGHPGEI